MPQQLIDCQEDSQESRCQIARECLYGKGRPNNVMMAFDILNELAKEGHADSQFLLGSMYERGEFVSQNFLVAMKFYHCAAKQNHIKAHKSLAILYEEGWGDGCFNLEKSFHHFKIGAAGGDNVSLSNLARYYEHGICVKRNQLKAVEYHVKSANAQNHRSFEWLMKLWLETGDAIEYMYSALSNKIRYESRKSKHVLNDDLKIKFKIENTIFEISKENFTGDLLLPEDVERFNQKLIMAKKGDMVSQYDVAMMYMDGVGVFKDNFKSWEFAKKSSKQKYAPAQFLMGELCGLQYDLYHTPERYKFYKDSSEQGYLPAIKKLGLISEITMAKITENYYVNIISETNKSEEIYNNYEKSAKAGDMYSCYVMGYMHHVGFRTSKDIEKAKKWYETAINLGHKNSSYNLNCIYEKNLNEKDTAQVNKSFTSAVRALEMGRKSCDDIITKYENLNLSQCNKNILNEIKSLVEIGKFNADEIKWMPQESNDKNLKYQKPLNTFELKTDRNPSDQSDIIFGGDCMVWSMRNLWEIPYTVVLQIFNACGWQWHVHRNISAYCEMGFDYVDFQYGDKYCSFDNIPDNSIILTHRHVTVKKNGKIIDSYNSAFDIFEFDNWTRCDIFFKEEMGISRKNNDNKKGLYRIPVQVCGFYVPQGVICKNSPLIDEFHGKFKCAKIKKPPFEYSENHGLGIPVLDSEMLLKILS